jgi:hypothetical protein
VRLDLAVELVLDDAALFGRDLVAEIVAHLEDSKGVLWSAMSRGLRKTGWRLALRSFRYEACFLR